MGKFIISFDCEGKWGLADSLNEYHRQAFTNINLKYVYKRIIDLLDKYEIPATFAFVGAFTLSVDEYKCYKDRIIAPVVNGRPWLTNFLKDAESGNYDGWLVPDCYQIVKQQSMHEIASHGFTHVPLSEKIITRNDFIYEMQLIQELFSSKVKHAMTFVYPRNEIGYVSELGDAGFIGYRNWAMNLRTGLIGIAREFNIWSKVGTLVERGVPIVIPEGHFLNCRSGIRTCIPNRVTTQRWKSMIKDAVANDILLHLWSHPHNFITGKDMFNLFESILKMLSFMQKRGEISVITQKEYCQKIQQEIIANRESL